MGIDCYSAVHVLDSFCTPGLISTEAVSLELNSYATKFTCQNFNPPVYSYIWELSNGEFIVWVCCTDTSLVEIRLAITAVMFRGLVMPKLYATDSSVVGGYSGLTYHNADRQAHQLMGLQGDCTMKLTISITKFYFTDWLDSQGCHTPGAVTPYAPFFCTLLNTWVVLKRRQRISRHAQSNKNILVMLIQRKSWNFPED